MAMERQRRLQDALDHLNEVQGSRGLGESLLDGGLFFVLLLLGGFWGGRRGGLVLVFK